MTKNNDGNWNGTHADPVSGTGGIRFSSIPGSFFFAGYCSAITGDNLTANFGGSAFSYPAPTGFSAWNAETTKTSWDANAESGMTLSNENLTATVSAAGTGGMAARGLTSWNTGKTYVEFRVGQVSPNGLTRVGIANSSWNYTQSEMLGRDANSFAYGSDGSIFVADVNVGTMDNFAAGDVLQLCVDFGAQLLWAAKNNDGNWNGTRANPATGSGGISFSAILGPWFVGYCSGNVGDTVTANFGASAFAYTAPSGFSPWGGGFGGGVTRPAALATYPGWSNYKNWHIGTNPGNNVTSISELALSGWVYSHDYNNTPVEVQEFNLDMSDGNPNVQFFENYCDFLAIWNGGPIVEAQNNGGNPNGNVTSMQVELPLDLTADGLTNIAYVEGTFKSPDVAGAWPAWWTIGHSIGGGAHDVTWGPEIDIMEVEGSGQVSDFAATLHAADNAKNKCFGNADDSPNIPPGYVDYVSTNPNQTVTYDTSGAGDYNLGDFIIDGVINASDGFHRYGCLIEGNYTISIWIDDQKIGHFDATQYCDDAGTKVALQLIIGLALSPIASPGSSGIDVQAFGGANNTTSSNLFRLSMSNIQIWGPPPP